MNEEDRAMSNKEHVANARPLRGRCGKLWVGAAGLIVSCAMMICASSRDASAQGKSVPHTQLFWGDLHLHSNYSLDAYATGNTTITPDLAYRYARGIPIQQPGLDNKIQIRRPLDFLAVTDHAEMMGLQVALDNRLPALLSTTWGQKLLEEHLNPKQGGVMRMTGGALSPDTPERREMLSQIFSDKVRSASWGDEVDAANRNYIPGKFTTLFGWEWSAMPGGKNLHRIVLANAQGEQAKNFIPYDNSASMRPEDLFKWLTATKTRTGIDFLAIPHNSNISGGLMFQMTDSDGNPISADYARARALWEPLVEVTQSKGSSEVHPDISTTDEFADFEIRRKLLAGTPTPPSQADYARYALMRGLEIQGKVGVNPYKFGMIGSTDSHTGMSNVTESAFTGKLVMDMPLSQHYKPKAPVIFPDWEMSASGRVAAWATENTRESLFAAFKRKEVYATTGTRIAVRLFGGYSFLSADAAVRDIASVGYAKGIPMGGDLTNAPVGKVPTFLIHAVKDPLSGNLDRVQVVKGWLDASGKSHEKVYDAAWSGKRKPGADGKLSPVGNTVDIRTGMYTNSIGAVQLATVWKDPDFKPGESAFYYVRVLEIPTPRHSLFDAIALGIDVKETKQPATIQERAYSSPIWYTPTRK
jgi:hypothetical protein